MEADDCALLQVHYADKPLDECVCVSAAATCASRTRRTTRGRPWRSSGSCMALASPDDAEDSQPLMSGSTAHHRARGSATDCRSGICGSISGKAAAACGGPAGCSVAMNSTPRGAAGCSGGPISVASPAVTAPMVTETSVSAGSGVAGSRAHALSQLTGWSGTPAESHTSSTDALCQGPQLVGDGDVEARTGTLEGWGSAMLPLESWAEDDIVAQADGGCSSSACLYDPMARRPAALGIGRTSASMNAIVVQDSPPASISARCAKKASAPASARLLQPHVVARSRAVLPQSHLASPCVDVAAGTRSHSPLATAAAVARLVVPVSDSRRGATALGLSSALIGSKASQHSDLSLDEDDKPLVALATQQEDAPSDDEVPIAGLFGVKPAKCGSSSASSSPPPASVLSGSPSVYSAMRRSSSRSVSPGSSSDSSSSSASSSSSSSS